MKYMGSKRRYAKHILPIILKDRQEGQYYVEPFCGGCNMIDKVVGPRIASDNHRYLIALIKALQSGWSPPKLITENLFNDIKNNPNSYSDELVGYVGSQMTFGSVWFSTIRRDRTGKRDMSMESYRNVIRQREDLKGIDVRLSDYRSLEIPGGSIIYCDPPYNGVTGYGEPFNSEEFYQWCRDMSVKGHSVFISEYSAPPDFKEIWSMKVTQLLGNTSKVVNHRVEKLFTV